MTPEIWAALISASALTLIAATGGIYKLYHDRQRALRQAEQDRQRAIKEAEDRAYERARNEALIREGEKLAAQKDQELNAIREINTDLREILSNLSQESPK